MKIKYLPVLLLITLFSCKQSDDVKVIQGDIYINEVSSSGDDWIELYNSSDQDITITNYSIYDDPENKYKIIVQSVVKAKSYLVLYCDGTGTGLNTSFKLSNQGEQIFMENSKSELIDQVEIPELDEGQTYARFPDGSATFTISGSGSPGESNGISNSPVISDISRTPLIPTSNDDVVIRAKVTDDSNSPTVKLHYMISGGGFEEIDMTLNQGLYEGTIPKLSFSGKIEYFIEARDEVGTFTLNPSNAPEKLYSYLISTDPLPPLKINEFMASNKTCCPDAENGDFDDWVEIYNSGTEPVDIGGLYISENKDNPFKYQIPTTDPSKTTIQPGGYLLLWADGQIEQGVLHCDIKLSVNGEDIGLYFTDGRKIDEYTFGIQNPDVSTGRLPNGADTWTTFSQPSPGAANH